MISTLLSALYAAPLVLPIADGEGPFKDLSVYDALNHARRANQIVLVAWTRPDDPACKRMEQTWRHASLTGWMDKHAVAVQIDGQAERRQAQNWAVSDYPTTLLVNPDGTVLLRVVGFRTTEELLVEADSAVQGVRRAGAGDIAAPTGEDAENPEAWLGYANALYALGEARAPECLQAYLWCIDHGDVQSPGFSDRYLDLILRRALALDKVTPATQELRARRSQLSTALAEGYGTPSSLRAIIRISEHLREPREAVRAFETVRSAETPDAQMVQIALDGVLATLIGNKRYQEIVDSAGDVPGRAQAEATKIAAALEGAAELAGGETAPDAKREYVERFGRYYEALLGAGRGADAKAVSGTVLQLVSTGHAYSVFIGHAKRAGVRTVAEALAAAGLEAIEADKGKTMITRALNATQPGIRRTSPEENADVLPKDGKGLQPPAAGKGKKPGKKPGSKPEKKDD